MELEFLSSIIKGDNNPRNGKIVFDSSDHIRFQNGQDFSGHNYNCHRRITIEKNIEDAEGIHCNNIQYGWYASIVAEQYSNVPKTNENRK